MNTKKNSINFSLILLLSIVVFSCKEEDKIIGPSNMISISGIDKSINENSRKGFVLGTIYGVTTLGDIRYTLSSQSPAGAMAINDSTGDVTVANATLFDFEINPVITAKVRGSVGSDWNEADIIITLRDLEELPTVQSRLDGGESPWDIAQSDSRYNTIDSFLGRSYQGGVIYYYDDYDGEGNIVAFNNIGSYEWGCKGVKISYTGGAMHQGVTDSENILAECSEANIAARVCDDLVQNGYSDWHLPSESEMRTALWYLFEHPLLNFTVGEFFWSSTQEDADQANYIWLLGGTSKIVADGKDQKHLVRPVRLFGK